MMKRAFSILSLLFVTLAAAAAGFADSLSLSEKPYSLIERSILPAALFTAGAVYNDYIIDQNFIHEGSIKSPKIEAVDYIQYSPMAIMYGLKAFGLESRSEWDRMFVSDAISAAVMVVIVNGLKYTICRERPDRGENNSFPSGHTANAFMGATMLHKEYGETVSPWFSVAGYGLATATAICRVEANRHWCSDVLAGAGVGIFSVEMGYEVSDLIFKDRHLKRSPKVPDIEDRATWSFSLQSSYSISTKYSDGDLDHTAIKPAYSLIVNADYLPWYLGATVSAGLTQLQWTHASSQAGHEVLLPDGESIPDIHFIGAGVVADIPLTTRISLNGRAMMGGTFGSDYNHKYTSGGPCVYEMPDASRAIGDIGLSIKTTGNTSVKAFAGVDFYEGVWRTYNLGTQFSFMF